MNKVTNISCRQIKPGDNDRQVFDQTKLEELAASIKAHDLAQPITVRDIGNRCPECGSLSESKRDILCHCRPGENPTLAITEYQIVAGERRFRAISQVLGWDTIPCIVRELTDEQASAIMLAENTGRADLDPIEEGNAYQTRAERFGWSNDKIAEVAGVSADLVKCRISLLKLVEEVRHLVANGHFPIGHAEAITDLDDNRQRIAVRIYLESKHTLSLRNFRQIVSQLLEEQTQDSLFDLENFWVAQVQETADLPRRGKCAITGAPTRTDLPQVEFNVGCGDNAAVIIDRYIHTLVERGFDGEAAAIGTVYTALVRGNYMAVPANARLTQS